MLLTSLLSIFILPIIKSRGTVYQCGDSSYADEQCLFQETLGDVNFIWVRKCKGAKVCLQLPYYNKIIGACNIKVRTHYDNEPCANNNKCTSGICDGTKCKGYDVGHSCIMGLGQCKRGLVCRFNSINDDIATCQSPVGSGGSCIHPSNADMTIKDDETSIYGSTYSFFVPWYNPCDLDLICNTNSIDFTSRKTGTCTSIVSVPDGTVVNNPILCSSGVLNLSNGQCISISTSESDTCNDLNDKPSCQLSSKGAYSLLNSSITTAVGNWRDQLKDNEKDSSKTNIEAYRYTRNNKKINKLFFNYTHLGWLVDADDCAFDYLWKNSKGNWIKVTFGLLFLPLIF